MITIVSRSGIPRETSSKARTADKSRSASREEGETPSLICNTRRNPRSLESIGKKVNYILELDYFLFSYKLLLNVFVLL